MRIPRILISAPGSGSGKSVITSALAALFSERFPVQCFKVGPDFIDPMYHASATGRPSRNLDSWILPAETNRRIFASASSSASLSIIEGVMGLFDGFADDPMRGSPASIARLLDCPVVIVLDCAKLSSTAAAILKGLDTFEPGLRIAGVVCNRVGKTNHAAWLRSAIDTYAKIPVLGCVPKLDALSLPERKLGLRTVVEDPDAARAFVAESASALREYLDLEKIFAIADAAPDFSPPPTLVPAKDTGQNRREPPVRIAVARDEAFCFYYRDNLDALERAGAVLVEFSPLRDARLPEGTDGILLGGGFPERYARRLSANTALLAELRARCADGTPVYAEGGGLIYLSQGFEDEGTFFPFVGTIDGRCRMGTRLKMGYRSVRPLGDTLLAEKGRLLRGHEFHYSEWDGADESRAGFSPAYERHVGDPDGPVSIEGWRGANVLASYVHLHFQQDPSLAETFIQKCAQRRTSVAA